MVSMSYDNTVVTKVMAEIWELKPKEHKQSDDPIINQPWGYPNLFVKENEDKQ